jgi:hypothetical protein
MNKYARTKLIPCCAIPLIVEINEQIVTSYKRGVTPDLQMPGLIDRAYYVFHETGLLPITDTDSDGSGSNAS